MLKKILFLFLLIVLFFPSQIFAKDITIVHFSDTHIDTKNQDKEVRKFAQTVPMFKRAIQKVNSIKPDIVVFSGDMVNKPEEAEFDVFLSIASELKVPFYLALGNHDVGVWGGLSKSTIFSKLNYSCSWLDIKKPYYSVIKDDFIFIFMDGTTDKIISANGFFSKDSLIFLDKTLAQNKDKKAVIIQHFPLMPPFKSISHEIVNVDEYFKIIDKHKNLVMVLAGHYHYFSEIIRNNVLHITTSSMIQTPHAYRQITIRDNENEIIVETKLIADEVLNPQWKQHAKTIKLEK